ncbi:MAG TPA: hypothetical protein VHY84_26295 [Bryobacteraceae bacterium]|jgi:hypothetical protein|nr:hypothetical protein [Bryobacteraceae bacterium]
MKQTGLPLCSLLSQALVAFTIEFDNEAEHRMRHRTSVLGGSPLDPWLVSLAMWSNCMQFVGTEGIRVGELEKRARTKTNLNGMVRWGYVVVSSDGIVHATTAGRKAQEVWRPLFGEIEKRWRERFGEDAVDRQANRCRVARLSSDSGIRTVQPRT